MTDSSPGGWHDEPPPRNPVTSPLLSPLPASSPPLPRATSAWGNYLRVIGAGCRIALLGRPSLLGLRLEPGLFWVLMVTSLLLECGWSWLAVEAPRQFDLVGLESQALFFLPLLLAGTVLARLSARPELLWRFAVLMVAAGLLSDALADLAYQHLLPHVERHKTFWNWVYYVAVQCWTLAITWRLLSLLGALRAGAGRGLAALMVTVLFAVLSYCMPDTDIWGTDYSAEYQQEREPSLVAEEVFSRQDELLNRALANIAPNFDNERLPEAKIFNPWIVAIVVTIGTFMEVLDTSIANVALPHIAGGLSASLDEGAWVLTSYLVANAVVLPISGWLSSVLGRKNYYLLSVTLFTVFSAACGFAPSLGMLVVFRVAQGLAGGGLQPYVQAILADSF